MATLRSVLETTLGVWEGSYLHLAPDGTVMERFPSRQEVRLEEGRWYERVIYLRDGQQPQVLDFRGRFEGDALVIDDPDFHGEATLIGDNLFVFPYHWKSRPSERTVETVSLPAPGTKVRLWQRFEDGELTRVTVIQERLLPGDVPEPWT